jgi:hypothetical protein
MISRLTLDVLYRRFEAIAELSSLADHWNAHTAVLDRLAANQKTAERHGWTSCALERSSRTGRITVWGLPPKSCQRHLIPDYPNEPG